MPVITGKGPAEAITRLKEAGGFDAAVTLGEQALAALNAGTVGAQSRADAEEILKAVTLLAAHLEGVTVPGVCNPNDPKSIVAHLAQGNALGQDLTEGQAKRLTEHLEAAIKAGTDLPQIAEAARNMDYGNPSKVAPAGLGHTAGNFGSSLKEQVKKLFLEHQPRAASDLGVDRMHGGLEAM